MKYYLFIRGADTDVKGICEAHIAIKKYAYILHDKGPKIKPHYHLFLETFNIYDGLNVYPEEIADWFGIPWGCIERCRSLHQFLLYCLFPNDKVYYFPSAIVANFDVLSYLTGSEE